jgi:hypothetical protein
MIKSVKKLQAMHFLFIPGSPSCFRMILKASTQYFGNDIIKYKVAQLAGWHFEAINGLLE